MRVLLLYASLVLALAVPSVASSTDPEILVMSAVEDAGGTTQADLNNPVLKMLERRSVEMLESKMRSYLASQGKAVQLPSLQAESHYVEARGTKLAVVRVRSPGVLNQVFIYGIKGNSFLRVACARTAKFEQAVPLFYGPCGDKIREVFGVTVQPK